MSNNTQHRAGLALMVSLFFLFGLITVFNDVLVPYLKNIYNLSYAEASFVQFCFFFAYFIMSIPAASIIHKFGYKHSVRIGLFIIAFGCLGFVGSAELSIYQLFLLSLFIIASGITLLQVCANSYISVLGSIENAANRLNLAGGLNSLATTIGPLLGSALILSEEAMSSSTPEAVKIPYLVLASLIVLISFVVRYVPLPNLETKESNLDGLQSTLKFKNLRLGVIAIFVYVGTEVCIGTFMINLLISDTSFLGSINEAEAGTYVAFYWGGAMVGRFFGFAFLKNINPAKALTAVSTLSLVAILLFLSLDGVVSIVMLSSIGLFHSIMWPCIFPLGVRNLGAYASQGASIMIMAVVGGAVMPPIQGYIADLTGSIKMSFAVLIMCYVYLLFYGYTGHKTG